MFGISWLDLVGILINIFTVVYILGKLLNKKINFRDYKNYIYTFLLFLLISLNISFVDTYMRFLISTVIISLYVNFSFKSQFSKTIIAVVLEQLIMFVSEIMVSMIVIIILGNNVDAILNTMMGTLFANLTISLVSILLITLPIVLNLCKKIINSIISINVINKYFYLLLFVVTLNILLSMVYFGRNTLYALAVNIIFIVLYSVILWLALREKDKNVQFKAENKALMDNLNDYEKMLDYQRVSNHENKNQLLVIKNMIEKKDNSTVEYIDEIIKDKREDNEHLLSLTKKIPTGGLQGIVYQKMLYMEDYNIKLNLDINKNIKEINFSNMSSKLNYDLCRMVGIFLDNAIDETIKINEKTVDLSLYCDEESLVVEISNKFNELPDMEKIDEKGYTTKEDGHGYGLSLVKEIIESNRSIVNERYVLKNIFVQKIKIKM